MPITYSFANAQRLVIKPFERLGFISLYLFATIASIQVTNFLIGQASFVHLWQHNPMQFSIIAGLMNGMLIGSAQWLILRRYFPDWRWILAVAVGSTFSNTLQFVFDKRYDELLFGAVENLSGSRSTAVTELTAIYMALLGTTVVAGFLEWYILQTYVAPAKWWMIIPLITTLVAITPWVLGVLTQQSISIPFPFLTNVIYLDPAIQAIAFCCLHKKSEQNIFQSALAFTPDITRYRKVQSLSNKLFARLTQLWTTELSASVGQLSYLIGVNSTRSQIFFEPMDTTSANNVDLTPLPTIASPIDEADQQLEGESFAKFQLLFLPPGIIQIRSWRGIPLIWISVGVYGAIVAIQYFLAQLQFG